MCAASRRWWVGLLVLAGLLITPPALGQFQETPEEKLAKEAWFKDARFGMFIHWGLFSAAGGTWEGVPGPVLGCYVQSSSQVDPAVYAQALMPKLTGERFDADAIADLAVDAGMKYVVVITKHHEGFCMFDSKLTDYTIMNTPAGKDWTGLTLDAARQRGLRTGVYYSLFDWHHPDYPIDDFHPLRGDEAARAQPRDLDRYLDYMHGQVMELMTNYGQIDIFWPDYSMPHRQGEDWRATELLKKVREKQPDILLNNRLQVIREYGRNEMGYGANFFTPEQKIPPQGYPGQLFEVCQTINKTWGYTHYDRDWKSPRTLVRELVDVVSKGGNYLLNIGPKPDGSVDPLVVDTLQTIGEWMQVHGESIYGTEATPFPEQLPWGRCTQKDLGDGVTRLYLHLFDWPLDQTLTVPAIGEPVGQPWVLSLRDQDKLEMQTSPAGDAWVIELPVSEPNSYGTVIVLDVRLK